jgi:hypothetical protein
MAVFRALRWARTWAPASMHRTVTPSQLARGTPTSLVSGPHRSASWWTRATGPAQVSSSPTSSRTTTRRGSSRRALCPACSELSKPVSRTPKPLPGRCWARVTTASPRATSMSTPPALAVARPRPRVVACRPSWLQVVCAWCAPRARRRCHAVGKASGTRRTRTGSSSCTSRRSRPTVAASSATTTTSTTARLGFSGRSTTQSARPITTDLTPPALGRHSPDGRSPARRYVMTCGWLPQVLRLLRLLHVLRLSWRQRVVWCGVCVTAGCSLGPQKHVSRRMALG